MADEIARPEEKLPAGMTPELMQVITDTMQVMLRPVLESMAQMLKNNTEAVQCLAAQEKIQTDRLNALEKEIRLGTLVTAAQSRYIADAAKNRARELLAKKGMEDNSLAVKKLTAAIKKSLMARYGIRSLQEIPKIEYPVAMEAAAGWNELLTIRDIVKACRTDREADE